MYRERWSGGRKIDGFDGVDGSVLSNGSTQCRERRKGVWCENVVREAPYTLLTLAMSPYPPIIDHVRSITLLVEEPASCFTGFFASCLAVQIA